MKFKENNVDTNTFKIRLGFTKECDGTGYGCKHGEGYPCLTKSNTDYEFKVDDNN